MTDTQFEIIDELYFLTSFKTLKDKLTLSKNLLANELLLLINQDWVAFFEEIDGLAKPKEDFRENNVENYLFLATKQGLLAHNSK